MGKCGIASGWVLFLAATVIGGCSFSLPSELATEISSDAQEQQEKALTGLVLLGPDAVPMMERAFVQSDDAKLRRRIIRCLGYIGNPAVRITALINLHASDNPRLRQVAADAGKKEEAYAPATADQASLLFARMLMGETPLREGEKAIALVSLREVAPEVLFMRFADVVARNDLSLRDDQPPPAMEALAAMVNLDRFATAYTFLTMLDARAYAERRDNIMLALSSVIGRDFGYSAAKSDEERKKAVANLMEWWKSGGAEELGGARESAKSEVETEEVLSPTDQ